MVLEEAREVKEGYVTVKIQYSGKCWNFFYILSTVYILVTEIHNRLFENIWIFILIYIYLYLLYWSYILEGILNYLKNKKICYH